MESEIINKEGCEVSFKTELDKETLKTYEKDVISEFLNKAKIKGFRQGKAPLKLIIKNYESQIKSEVLSKNMNMICFTALEKLELKPLTEPVIEKFTYNLSENISFEAKVDVFPEFELSDYKSIKVKRLSQDVSDADVDKYITEMAEYSAPFETVEDRELKEGDFAIIDFEVLKGEETAEQKNDFWMKIITDHEDKYIAEFCKGIEGMNIAEKKEISVTMPADYTDEELAGKTAAIKVELKGIRKKNIPAIDDEYVKKLGQDIESLDQYKEKVKSYLSEQKKMASEGDVKNQVANYLLENNSLDLPKSIIKNRLDEGIKREISMLTQRGADEETIKGRSEEILKSVQEKVTNQLKLEFILGRIVENEKIEATDEEYNTFLKNESEKMGVPLKDFRKYLKDQNREGSFRQSLIVEKVYSHILEFADITEA